MNQPKVECVSGDCEEMIYFPFWKAHGGYCTKHPEKWPQIKRENGAGSKPKAKTTYYRQIIKGISSENQRWLDDQKNEHQIGKD